jgi:hypothetical protein
LAAVVLVSIVGDIPAAALEDYSYGVEDAPEGAMAAHRAFFQRVGGYGLHLFEPVGAFFAFILIYGHF